MEQFLFRKAVNTNNNWTFVLGNSGASTPTFVIVGFQATDENDSQTHDNAIFDRLPISNAICKIGSKKYTVDGIKCDYDRDNSWSISRNRKLLYKRCAQSLIRFKSCWWVRFSSKYQTFKYIFSSVLFSVSSLWHNLKIFIQSIHGQYPLCMCLFHERLWVGFKYILLPSNGFKASISCFWTVEMWASERIE